MPIGGQSRLVILLIGGDQATFERLTSALSDCSIEHASGSTAALSFLADHEPAVVFVDVSEPELDDEFLATARDRADGAALVAIVEPGGTTDGSIFDDHVTTTADAETVRQTAEQSVRAREYQEAVARLYELCEEEAGDGWDDEVAMSEEIKAARQEADERLTAFREAGDAEFERLFRD